MARYVRRFTAPQVPLVHREFLTAIRLANEAGRPQTARLLQLAHIEYQRGLREVAVKTSKLATKGIKEQLSKTARRPDTGVRPHLRDGIRSAPLGPIGGLESGIVQVASLAALENVVNPDDPNKVPYWIVQEEGSRANIGRTLVGFFYDRGFQGPTKPAPGYTGTAGAQPLFAPGTLIPGPRGGRGGKGVITNPIPARHFVRDGRLPALAEYRRDLNRVQVEASKNIAAAFAAGKPPVRPVRRPRRLRRRGLS